MKELRLKIRDWAIRKIVYYSVDDLLSFEKEVNLISRQLAKKHFSKFKTIDNRGFPISDIILSGNSKEVIQKIKLSEGLQKDIRMDKLGYSLSKNIQL